MKKLVVFPSDPMKAYIDLGQTYEYFEDYFNPGEYFDEVYALSPWGENDVEIHGKVRFIKEKPHNFKRKIKEIKPCVVRAYGGYCCSDWLAMSRMDDIPTVVSVHDTNPDLIYESIKYADNVVYMAKCVQDAVRKKVDCTGKGEWVMGNRIDTQLFTYCEDRDFFARLNQKYGKGKHILHIGRKTTQKNLDTVIKALRYLPDDVSVIFIGKGDFEPYEMIAKELNVDHRVFSVDHVNNSDLPKWYSWCDCFCTPSRWEGFGFVFIEAASCKASIVTSDIRPMNEYLTNGINSILVKDFENPKMIADAIGWTIENTDDSKRLGENARKVGERFSKELVDKQEIEIYKRIIETGPRTRNKVSLWERAKMELKYR